MNLNRDDILKMDCKLINPASIGSQNFKSVKIDSRTCGKNDIFFAVTGENLDGHNYVSSAYKNGACIAVVNEKWHLKNKNQIKNMPVAVVKDTTKALGELANIYRKKFVLPVICIAGSNGKTTTRDLIASILSQKYNVLKSEKNYNNQFGVPLTLFRLNQSHEIAVIELGMNHFGEIKNLCGISMPQYGVITNIGREHLEFLKDVKGVAKAEGELFTYLQTRYGTLFVNADDKFLRKHASYPKSITFGASVKADIKGKITGFNNFYPSVNISARNFSFKANLSLPGFQSFSSSVCAAAVSGYFEVSPSIIKKSLSEFTFQTPGRNQLIVRNGINIIDDTYNSNPESVIAALQNLKKYKIKGRKHIVLADMLEMGASSKKEHTKIGRIIYDMGFKNLYTYGKNAYWINTGANKLKNNFHFDDKNSLLEMLKVNVKEGDIVLIKGSHSMHMEFISDSL